MTLGFCAWRAETINRTALATIRKSGRISVLNTPQVVAGVAAILRFRPDEQVVMKRYLA